MNLTKSFIINIIWLNMKKFKFHVIWRIFFVIINFMLFFATTFEISPFFLNYLVVIVSLSNILFIFSRVNAQIESINLMRSFGASRLFIVIDHLFEIFFEIIIAVILFLVILPFRKPSLSVLLPIFSQLLIVVGLTPLFSLLTISRLEKQKKEL